MSEAMLPGAEALWDVFVSCAGAEAAKLDEGVARLLIEPLHTPGGRALLGALGEHAFAIASQSLLMGAEDLGRLALACERSLDYLRDGTLTAGPVVPVLASSVYTLRRALEELAARSGTEAALSQDFKDRSGPRTDRLPLEAARFELETFFPVPGKAPPGLGAPDVPLSSLTRRGPRQGPQQGNMATAAEPAVAPAPVVEPAAGASNRWEPTVDDDMVELFFDEARERIEELSIKLLDVEQRPRDAELLRGVFRDLHTLKGSSAMVGLELMNTLAHSAEDLVGELRDGRREVNGAIIDALLAALDGLRDIVAMAQGRQLLDMDISPILSRLRHPEAALHEADDDLPDHALTRVSIHAGQARQVDDAAPLSPGATSLPGQTIRVDFDKLDRLMNLVGELVLGRDGLRNALQALAAVAGELTSDRQHTRRLSSTRALAERRVPGVPGVSSADRDRQRAAPRDALSHLSEEVGRVERVLTDISQDLDRATSRLDSVSDELRDQVMKLRMVPISGVFRKHQRTVRDLATALGKRVRLELAGEDTELDKLLVETLDEPLMHLVRNAVDHGIELPAARMAAGKSAEGVVRLSAKHRGNQMVIQIRDDGKGIDPEALRRRARERGLLSEAELLELDDRQVLDVIFRPGFSTATMVSQVSGRGVGMDVVRQTIVNRLKGTIDIDSSKGAGTTFTLRLPLTLAIIQVLLARAGGELFAIPLDPVVRTISCSAEQIRLIQDREVIEMHGRQVPLIRLTRVLELEPDPYIADAIVQVVLTEVSGELFGLACDHLIGKKEIVIKSLGDLLQNVPCTAGATILGERCALILDVPAIVQRALQLSSWPAAPAAGTSPRHLPAHGGDERAPHVLVVEDSDTVRESLRRLLVDAGFRCTVAADGVDGLRAAGEHRFDMISTDVMMPRMDGYELTRALRAMPVYRDTPIIMVTSRGERIDRVRGFDAGVDEYITKPHDRQLVLRAVRKLTAARERHERETDDQGGER